MHDNSTNQTDKDKELANHYRSEVRNGNIEAMVQLGILYVTGKGVQQNLERAENYFQRAADAGDSNGWLWLGKIYSRDSTKKSLTCYEKAAALGNKEAIQNIKERKQITYDDELQKGIFDYEKFKRTGREDKLIEAFHCFTHLAKSGHTKSIDKVINLLDNKQDTVKIGDRTIRLFDNKKDTLNFVIKAVKLENVTATYYLGVIYQEGLYGVQKNLEKAAEFFEKASERGYSKAMRSIGNLYAKGYGDLDEEDEESKVIEWCLKATKENDVWGFYYIGKYFDEQRNDFATALEWYERALTSITIPNTIEATADMLTSQWPEAFSIESRIGKSMSMYSARSFMCYLADRCESTLNDIEQAKKWYGMAARHGSVLGKKSLKHIEDEEFQKTKIAKVIETVNDVTTRMSNPNNYTLTDLQKLSKDPSLSSDQRKIYQKALDERRGRLVAERDKQRMAKGTGKNCFITTAVCSSLGKADDCYELMAFRNFRDCWLKNEADGSVLIDKYYDIAPKIVKAIDQQTNHKEIYINIWNSYLRLCLQYIEQGNFQLCKEKYISMVNDLKKEFF